MKHIMENARFAKFVAGLNAQGARSPFCVTWGANCQKCRSTTDGAWRKAHFHFLFQAEVNFTCPYSVPWDWKKSEQLIFPQELLEHTAGGRADGSQAKVDAQQIVLSEGEQRLLARKKVAAELTCEVPPAATWCEYFRCPTDAAYCTACIADRKAGGEMGIARINDLQKRAVDWKLALCEKLEPDGKEVRECCGDKWKTTQLFKCGRTGQRIAPAECQICQRKVPATIPDCTD
jgi:hypothetical protein